MPRARTSRASRASNASKKERCTCNWGWLIAAWILVAVGLWSLVGGFATQFLSVNPLAMSARVLFWYFLGILLVSLGKMAKWKAYCCCMVHEK